MAGATLRPPRPSAAMPDPTLHAAIAANLDDIRARIAAAAVRAGGRARRRVPGRRVEDVRRGPRAGRRARPASATSARTGCRRPCRRSGETAEAQIRWHLIGHLQSNKARKAVGPFAAIHSVDSVDLLGRLDAVAAETGAGAACCCRWTWRVRRPSTGRRRTRSGGCSTSASAAGRSRSTGLMLLPPLLDDPERGAALLPRGCASCATSWRAAGVPGGDARPTCRWA